MTDEDKGKKLEGAPAVIYLRVSSKEQAEKGGEAEGFSIPAQREACKPKGHEPWRGGRSRSSWSVASRPRPPTVQNSSGCWSSLPSTPSSTSSSTRLIVWRATGRTT